MHHRTTNRHKLIEQRLNHVLSKAQPKKSTKQRIIKSAAYLCVVLIISAPLWLGLADPPQSDIKSSPIYYKIEKISVEYPEGLQPTITLIPARSGCASMVGTCVNVDNAPPFKI